MKITEGVIQKKLAEVMDPEISISIVDLGLIYGVKMEHPTADGQEKVVITMTLTTIGCPLISMIEEEIKNKLREIGIEEKDVVIDLTFDPPWSMEKMSKKGKAMLGIT